MNRKIFLERATKILVVVFVMFIQTLFAQDAKHHRFCHVIDDENAAKNFITDGGDLQRGSCTAYYINVFFHFIRDNSGATGQPVSNVSQYMTILNNAYSGHNIHFISIGYDEINNSTLADPDYDHMNNFGSVTMNHQSNAINIYIFRADKTISGGVATRPGTRVAIGGGDIWTGNYALSHVLSHEVGHALNLLHTFNGTAPGSSSGCAENPDGSNGVACGDEVADTPADPNIAFLNAGNCTNPFTMVVGGTTYNPNPTNIMSYATPNCLNHFTTGQGTRMATAAGSLTVLQPIRAKVTGPGTICTTGSFSVVGGVPSGTTVTWNTSNSSALTINSSGVGTRVGSFSGNVSVSATLTNSNGCSMTTGNFLVWVGPPNVNSILPNSPICTGDIMQLTAFPLNQGPGTIYSWTVIFPSNGGFSGATNTPSVYFQDHTAETSHISVLVTNACGNIGADVFINTVNCLMSYQVYPNPAKDYITIDFETPVSKEGLPEEIVLYSEKSTNPLIRIDVMRAYSQKEFINGSQVKIRADDLPRGVYYLHLNYGNRNEPRMHRIILE